MCDVERLLFLIKIRPAIYNGKLKAHNDKRQIAKLWSEIASEMQITVKECKTKYTSLRSAYSRFLRAQLAPGSAQKKPWYLAPALTFMKSHMIVRKNIQNSEQPETDTEDDNTKMSDCAESRDYIPSSSGCIKRSYTTTDRIAEPTTEYVNANYHKSEDEDANHTFFKSMLPDMRKLTDKNQRKLKQDFLMNLNKLLEEQEFENMPKIENSV